MDPRQPGVGPDATELLEDWITIWQSELTALILDRETQDTILRLVDGWAAQSRAAVALLHATPQHPRPERALDARRPAGTDAAARAAPAPAAPDARDVLVEQLLARVSELERRLARFDPGAGTPPR